MTLIFTKKKYERICTPGFGISTTLSSFYSATSIFVVLRNLVQEIWFKKSGSRKVVDQKKRWFYTINLPFSGSRKVVDQKKKSEFAKPLF